MRFLHSGPATHALLSVINTYPPLPIALTLSGVQGLKLTASRLGRITSHGTIKRTKTMDNCGGTARFLETLSFPKVKGRQVITVEVLDSDTVSDDFLGSVQVDVHTPDAVPGLKWRKLGREKPEWSRKLSNLKLADMLVQKAAAGRKWKMAGAEKPTQGRELSDSELATALEEGRAEFTQKEWEAFGIDDLRSDDFIKAGDSFFVMANEIEFTQGEWNALGIKDLRASDFIEAGDAYFQPLAEGAGIRCKGEDLDQFKKTMMEVKGKSDADCNEYETRDSNDLGAHLDSMIDDVFRFQCHTKSGEKTGHVYLSFGQEDLRDLKRLQGLLQAKGVPWGVAVPMLSNLTRKEWEECSKEQSRLEVSLQSNHRVICDEFAHIR